MGPPSPAIGQSTGSESRGRYVVLWIVLTFFALVGLGAYGLTSCLRLSRDTIVLRDCMLHTVPGRVEKKIAVSVGPITSGFVRLGSRFFSVPPEPRAALDSFRSGEVGIYRLEQPPSGAERASIIAKADKAMAGRGWTRIVGVAQKDGFVTVYVPEKRISMGRMKCCVLVVNNCEAVLVSARANLNPLIALATTELNIHQQFQELAANGFR